MRFLASVACGLLLMVPSRADAQSYIDREAAAEHPDAALQGEYLGEVEGEERQNLGVQVAARGEGTFEALVYRGGLPGAGWDGSEPSGVEGERHGGAALFTWDEFTARVSGGSLHLSHAEWGDLGALQRVERKSPTLGKQPPQGAILLFDGSERSWEHWQQGAQMDDHARLVEGATSRQDFGDIRLHAEFMYGFMPGAAGQDRGNSGVYLQNRYEIQILDSFTEPPTIRGNGSIYNFREPDVNMSFPPLVWQTYDIDFTAPRFDADGQKIANARVTVMHNGVLIHDDVELPGGTGAGGRRPEVQRGPLHLQDHGDPVRFRNVWLVEKN